MEHLFGEPWEFPFRLLTPKIPEEILV